MSLSNSCHGVRGLQELFKRKEVKVHFIGVGGISMSALAILMKRLGYTVSGSDIELGERTARLAERGIAVCHISDTAYLSSSDVGIYTLAIPEDSPPIQLAREQGIPLVSRAELLGLLSLSYKCRIGIGGSHGKSTTTAMVSSILSKLGLCPTVLSGYALSDGTSLVEGGKDFLVYEACEYRDSFLSTFPTVAVVTNAELDHTDYFATERDIIDSFRRFLSLGDVAVYNRDDPRSATLSSVRGAVSFGRGEGADFRYSAPIHTSHGMSFRIFHGEESIDMHLNRFAEYDAANATAAVAAVCSLGVDFSSLEGSLDGFSGIGRRCELLRHLNSRPIYYDYAHHPTEIEATLRAVRDRHGAVTVVFRPHTYSRTRDLWEGFVRALSVADFAVLTEIYPAREEPVFGVDSHALATAVGGVCLGFSEVADYVVKKTVGAVILMGAGDLDYIKKVFEEM